MNDWRTFWGTFGGTILLILSAWFALGNKMAEQSKQIEIMESRVIQLESDAKELRSDLTDIKILLKEIQTDQKHILKKIE